MAWVGFQSFEGLSDESNLNGQSGSGAIGWSNNLTNVATNLEYADTATAYDGSVSARVVSNAGNTFYTQDLTTTISSGTGVMYVALRKSSTSAGVIAFSLRGAGNRCNINLTASGTIVTGGESLGSFSADTWYLCRISYDMDAETYTGAYWNGSSWVESSTRTMGSSGALSKVGYGGDTGSNSWVDFVSPNSGLASSSISSIAGVTQANIKSMAGVTNANIKSVAGVANS